MRNASVVSHGLVMKYKDKSVDPRAAGRDFNVRYLVEGDLREDKGALAVMARLVETAIGTQVWNGQVETPGSATTDNKDNIVAQLVTRLTEALFYAERRRVEQLPSAGAARSALALTLRASALGQDRSPASQLAARNLYDEALRHNPNSAPALIGLYWIVETQLKDDPASDHARRLKELDDLSSRAVRADHNDPRATTTRVAASPS